MDSARAIGARRLDHPQHQSDERDQGHAALEWPDASRIATVALAAGAVWFHLWEPLPDVSVIDRGARASARTAGD